MKKEAHRAGVPAVPRAAPTRSAGRGNGSLAQKYSLDTGNGSRKSHQSTALDRTLTPQNCGLPAAAQGDVSLWGHSSRSWASPPCPRRAPSQTPGPATARKRRPLPPLNPADPTRGRQGEGQRALGGGGGTCAGRGRGSGPAQRAHTAPPAPPAPPAHSPTGGPELPPRGARGLREADEAEGSQGPRPDSPTPNPHPPPGAALTLGAGSPARPHSRPRPHDRSPQNPEPRLTGRPSCQRLLRGAAPEGRRSVRDSWGRGVARTGVGVGSDTGALGLAGSVSAPGPGRASEAVVPAASLGVSDRRVYHRGVYDWG
nr:basic salivary proline-rich protein 1-like [Camelus dromedarius]